MLKQAKGNSFTHKVKWVLWYMPNLHFTTWILFFTIIFLNHANLRTWYILSGFQDYTKWMFTALECHTIYTCGFVHHRCVTYSAAVVWRLWNLFWSVPSDLLSLRRQRRAAQIQLSEFQPVWSRLFTHSQHDSAFMSITQLCVCVFFFFLNLGAQCKPMLLNPNFTHWKDLMGCRHFHNLIWV